MLLLDRGRIRPVAELESKPQPIPHRRPKWSEIKTKYEATKRDEAWKARIAEIEALDLERANAARAAAETVADFTGENDTKREK